MLHQLIQYGLDTGLMPPDDRVYTFNRLLAVMKLDEWIPSDEPPMALHEILQKLTDDAVERGVCADDSTSRELFDTALMDCLMPRPSQVHRTFEGLYDTYGPEAATDWYYALSQNSNYIRRDRIAKDRKWVTNTKYGVLEITINLSKPEKDPKDIAAQRNAPQVGYPACMLCVENPG